MSVFGKHFSSMYSGSMFGNPAMVFAVWGYAIAHMRPSKKDGQCYVELNPTLLAATFAATPEQAVEAIETLCAPDPASRTKTAEGRRIVLVSEKHLGPMQFRVVNGEKYRSLRDEEERRAYLREKKRDERAAKKSRLSTNVATVNHGQPSSTQAEVEVEVDSEAETKESKSKPLSPAATRTTPQERVEAFNPNEKQKAWAEKIAPSVPIGEVTDDWRDRCRESGYRSNAGPIQDAAASWRRWVRNAEKFGTYAKGLNQKRAVADPGGYTERKTPAHSGPPLIIRTAEEIFAELNAAKENE